MTDAGWFVVSACVLVGSWIVALCLLESDEEIMYTLRLTGWLLLVLGGGYFAVSLAATLALIAAGIDPRSWSL